MRAIGEVRDHTAAQEFQKILYAHGIDAEIERGEKEGWLIWVKSDDDCPRAAEMLGWYRENPKDPRFKNATEQAETARRRASEDQANYERRTRQVRKSFVSLKGYRFGPLTFALIFISAAVFVMTRFGEKFEPVESLWFSNYVSQG
jgi:hypothetical protein